MNEKLQQAIIASRAGQKREAQRLLTQVIKEDPGEAQAWFLLSHLVDSEQKQIAYLSKVVALDPNHERAKARLARLAAVPPSPSPESVAARQAGVEPAPPPLIETETSEDTGEPALATLPVSSKPTDFLAQEKADTLPDWMADDAEHLNLAEAVTAETPPLSTTSPSPPIHAQAELPEWLQQPVAEAWGESKPEEEEKEEVSAEVTIITNQPSPAVKQTAKPAKTNDQSVMLTRLLIGLIFAAAIVFVLLVYFAIQAF